VPLDFLRRRTRRRPAVRVATALLALAASAATAASASTAASTSTLVFFRTPSANIACLLALDGPQKTSVRCDIKSGLRPRPRPPAGCDLDSGDSVELSRSGRASLVCHGDTVINPRARVVGYGQTIARNGVACTSRFAGLTCTNRAGHGFFLSRQRWRTF
jgi:hypothetical protein